MGNVQSVMVFLGYLLPLFLILGQLDVDICHFFNNGIEHLRDEDGDIVEGYPERVHQASVAVSSRQEAHADGKPRRESTINKGSITTRSFKDSDY